MGLSKLDKIVVTDNKIISVDGGNVMHGIKSIDHGFVGFGEVYFSWIKNNSIKAWKKHKLMTLNLIVPFGKVEFLFCDDEFNDNKKIIIGSENFKRITVPPGIWFGFKGHYKESSLVVNCTDILHDPSEVDVMSIKDKPFSGD